MTRAFDAALKVVLHHEGGYVDHPKDPGGRTNMGITQKVLDMANSPAIGMTGLPNDVRALTYDDAAAIYHALYWNAVSGDDLPPGVAMIVFDCAVNQGAPTARRILQAALRVPEDGVIGPATLAAVAKANPVNLIREIAARRAHAYMKLDSLDDTFGLGWARRLFDVYDSAIAATKVGA